ncbi:serine-rich aggregation substance UasX [Leuconostoc lactis]|uniref:serine-rich aggregation substance UasX n=1 Tax=Leuconostoc lactis TaxID=1246 RepID=UPI0006DC73C7|nr:serine-rich aggregation substance UasX [Leuconostoc lactis]KQB80221.1 hypothetical protein AN225_08390 [Leuconostoc lactis]
MLKRSILLSGAVLGALAFGSQTVHADTSTISGPTQTSGSGFSDNDDSQLPPANTNTGNTGNTGTPSGTSGASQSTDGNPASGTPVPTPSDNQTNGSTLPVSQSGSATSGTNAPSSANSNSATSSDAASTSTPTGNQTPVSGTTNTTPAPNPAPQTTNPTVNTPLPTHGLAPAPVPLTNSTPDVNDQGELNQVTPVPVQQPSQGQAPVVPVQVASVPSVARAVQDYNQALTSNGNNGNNDKVVEAKQKLDDAVAKALPETHAQQPKSNIGILSAMAGILALSGVFLFKRFKK